MTPREFEVLNLMAIGKCNREIAKHLIVSIHTVKAHADSIYEKLKVHNRVQACIRAIQENIIKI